MKNNLKCSIFVAALFLLALVPNSKVFAATPTITAADTTANVVNVDQVHAIRIITIDHAIASSTAGNAPAAFTIGSCVVSFATTTTGGNAYVGSATLTKDENDCGDGVATILLSTTTNATALPIATLAQNLRTLKNVIDVNHGSLAVASTSNDISFTSTSTETTATNIIFSTSTPAMSNSISLAQTTTSVVPVTAVAQVTTFTPSNSVVNANYDYSITINTNTYTYRANGQNTTDAAAGLASAMSGDTAVTCTASVGVITCTAQTPGNPFTYSSNVTPVAVTSSHSSSGGGHGGGGGISAAAQGCSGGNLVNASTGKPCVNNVGNPKAAPNSAAFMRTLSQGSQGDDVKALQTRLLSEGLFKGDITGYFGKITMAAVKAYQAKYGIEQLGIVGPMTMAQLNKNNLPNQVTPTQISVIMSQINALVQQIQALQAKLKAQNR